MQKKYPQRQICWPSAENVFFLMAAALPTGRTNGAAGRLEHGGGMRRRHRRRSGAHGRLEQLRPRLERVLGGEGEGNIQAKKTKRATSANAQLLRPQSSDGKFTMSRAIEPVQQALARLVPSGTCGGCLSQARLRLNQERK